MPEDIIEPQFTTNVAGEFSLDMLNRSIDVSNKLYAKSNIGNIVEDIVNENMTKVIVDNKVDIKCLRNYCSRVNHSTRYCVSGMTMNSADVTGIDNERIDVYRYASSAMLAEAANAVKKILTSDKCIEINKSSIESKVIIPLNLEERLGINKKETGDPFMLVRRAAEQLIQGIETELSLINTYYSIHEQRTLLSKGLEHFLIHKISKIRNYTKDLGMIVPILEDFSFFTEAGALNYTVKMLNSKELLEQAIKKDNLYHVTKNLLSTHALLLGEKFSGNPYLFLDSSGEEISLSMLLAKNTRDAINVVSHVTSKNQLDKRRHIVSSEDGYIQIIDADKIRSSTYDGQGHAVASLIDMILGGTPKLMKIASNPFFELAQKLDSFGIPFEIAKSVENRFSLTQTNRTYPNQIDDLHYEEACSLVMNNGKDFISGIREVVHRTTGVKPKQTAYLNHKSKKSILWAPGISSLAYITNNDSDNNIELYREFATNEDEITLMKRLESFYPDKDSYARMNTGACFLFSFNHLGSIINNFNPIIDIREITSTMFNKQAGKDLYMHVALHEMDHNAQIGSRLIWRHVAACIMDWTCKSALIHIQDENYNKPMPFRANNRTVGVKNWKDTFIDAAASYCIPALATGLSGEKYRDDSFFVTMMDRGNNPLDEKNLDFNYALLEKVKIEDSLTSKLFHETIEVLKKGSEESLRHHIVKIQNHGQELLSILEHMAESFSLYASKIVLETTAQTDTQKIDAVNRYESLKRNIVGRGEWAKLYQDILKNVDSDNMDEALRVKGMKYCRTLNRIESDRIENRIVRLGYNPYEPNDAYHDMNALDRKAKNAGLKMNNILMPMNGARALIGLRYSTQVDTYLDIIHKYGSKNAFKLILNCENFGEVQRLLSDKR